MKTFAELKEKTLTNAEKRKREEVARAMERENPDMDMDKKMAIATATAKRVAEAGEMVRAKSADKKPQLVTLPNGKRVIRLVPTQARREKPVEEAKKKHVDARGNTMTLEPRATRYAAKPNTTATNLSKGWVRGMSRVKSTKDKVVDEALERDGPKQPDIFGPKGSFGKAASLNPHVQKYMSKRAASNQARNKAMDPGAAKKGYGIGVTDVAKADKKAKEKGTSILKRMASSDKNYKAGRVM